MNPEYVTYHSRNAPKSKRWIAYIMTSDVKDYWPIRFSGETELDVLELAREHYATCEEDRKKAAKRKEESRERMRKLQARKRENAEGRGEL